MQKGTTLSSCNGEQEGPLSPRLPNYMCLSFLYSLAPLSGLSYLLCWMHQTGTRDQIAKSLGLQKKQENSRRMSTASLTTLKHLTVWITASCGKLLKRWEHQTVLPASWEICMQFKNQQNWTWNNGLVTKLGKEYVKAVYCHLAYLTCMQSTSCEMPGWMKHKLESRLLGEISITSYMQMIPPLWQKARRN